MATYVLGDIAVKDAARFGEYSERVGSVLAKFGARYLVRGGDVEVLEGTWRHNTVVVLEFPSRAAADEFYRSDEYAPLLKLRLDSSDSTISILEGYDDEKQS